jgi:hypothetical protein
VHEQPGLAVGDDLGDAADVARDHGGLAGHRLEVDDAERLVDRRAHEHRRVREHLAHLLARAASRSPRTRRRALARSSSTAASVSAFELRGVGRAGEQDELDVGSNWSAARSRCGTPFWRVIRPTNTDDGRSRSTPSRSSTVGVGSGCVELGVDAVVDDVDLGRRGG